jgi:hypothetical protein
MTDAVTTTERPRKKMGPKTDGRLIVGWPPSFRTPEEAIEGLAELGCPEEEIAAFLQITLPEMTALMGEKKFADAFSRGKLLGRARLRFYQHKQSEQLTSAGVSMLIHMSKQPGWLGEYERPFEAFSPKGSGDADERRAGQRDILALLSDAALDRAIQAKRLLAGSGDTGPGGGET